MTFKSLAFACIACNTYVEMKTLEQFCSGLESVTDQKHCRVASLEAVAPLCVSSCSQVCFFSHRERRLVSQLTAATRLPKHGVKGLNSNLETNKKGTIRLDDSFLLAPQTGLEPVTPRLTAACSTD